MDSENLRVLVARVRQMGMELWVEDGRVRGRMRAGGKIPYNVRLLAEELRDMGQVAVAYLEAEARGEAPRANVAGDAPPWDNPAASGRVAGVAGRVAPEPDAGGWVVLEGVDAATAFAVGPLIDDGKAELIGKVIYRQRSNTFDLTYKLLEG